MAIGRSPEERALLGEEMGWNPWKTIKRVGRKIKNAVVGQNRVMIQTWKTGQNWTSTVAYPGFHGHGHHGKPIVVATYKADTPEAAEKAALNYAASKNLYVEWHRILGR